MQERARIAVDIGGILAIRLQMSCCTDSTKVLTTPNAPEQGVLDGISRVLEQTRVAPRDVALIIHYYEFP